MSVRAFGLITFAGVFGLGLTVLTVVATLASVFVFGEEALGLTTRGHDLGI